MFRGHKRSNSARCKRDRRGINRRRLTLETLESRALLSAATPPLAEQFSPTLVHFDRPGSTAAAGPASSLLGANQVRAAYGLGIYDNPNSLGVLSNGLAFAGYAGDGAGQTIAIVDVYDYPTALSDLNAFAAYYKLPQFNTGNGPTFTKLNESGATSPLPAASGSSGWSTEEALDIEWAHTIAPMANIVLVEASSAANGDLYPAVQAAAGVAGVVAVSMSWSGNEYSTETSDDSTFTTPANHLGGIDLVTGASLPGSVTFLAATGDNGAYPPGATRRPSITPQYPAASPNVVAVGGTNLTVNGSAPNYSYGGETSWGNGTNSWKTYASGGTGSGGGISKYESQPAFQKNTNVVNKNFTYSTTKRVYPDISAVGGENSAVAVYDSYDYPSAPWEGFLAQAWLVPSVPAWWRWSIRGVRLRAKVRWTVLRNSCRRFTTWRMDRLMPPISTISPAETAPAPAPLTVRTAALTCRPASARL